jgi:hypothetical protein
MGLEPTTLGTTNRCSNQLSYIYRIGGCKNRNSTVICKAFLKLQSPYRNYLERFYLMGKFVHHGRATGGIERYGNALQ